MTKCFSRSTSVRLSIECVLRTANEVPAFSDLIYYGKLAVASWFVRIIPLGSCWNRGMVAVALRGVLGALFAGRKASSFTAIDGRRF